MKIIIKLNKLNAFIEFYSNYKIYTCVQMIMNQNYLKYNFIIDINNIDNIFVNIN